MTAHALHRAPLLALGLLVLAGCASADPLTATPVATSAITVEDNTFGPPAVTVPAGTEVAWTWQGSHDHNIVGQDFEGPTQHGGSFSTTFEEPGTYPYRCTLHGGMRGVVRVTG